MISGSIDTIDKSAIERLIHNQTPESKTLEYKQKLPSKSDEQKKEFLADVSSFANASGGDIIYGIKTARDENNEDTARASDVDPIVGENFDQARRRLEQIIETGLVPRLSVQIHEVPGWGSNGKDFVIVLRIPQSLRAPHMINQGSPRFYSRGSSRKYAMDIDLIKSAFLASELQAVRIRGFRQERLARIVADEMPVRLCSSMRLVLHVIPIIQFLNNHRLGISSTNDPLFNQTSLMESYPTIPQASYGNRYNLDGFVTFTSEVKSGAGCDSYCQLFYNGAIEAVMCDTPPSVSGYSRNGPPSVFEIYNERYLIRVLKCYLPGHHARGIDGPMAVALSLLDCKGVMMSVDYSRYSRNPIDRKNVIVPETVFEDIHAQPAEIMRHQFDAIWNACGYPRSLNYDDKGIWHSSY